MVRLRLLGTAGLMGPDGREARTVLRQPKRLALLAYLALAPRSGFCRRDTLMGVFWPDQDQDHARNALRQALHFLRSALGPGLIESRGDDEVRIGAGALWCDALAFRDAVTSGRLAESVELYEGDLLPGFFVADAPEFERWLELERSALRDAAVAAAWRLAEGAGPDDASALHWARHAAALTPDDEPSFQRLLRFLLDRGDRAGALRAYESFRRRLRSEFGLSPSAQTVRLVREIRAHGEVGDEAGPAPAEAPDPAEAAAPDAAADLPARDLSRPAARPTPREPGPAARRGWRGARAAGALVTLAAIGAAGVWLVRGGSDPVARGLDADLVAVSPFEVQDARHALWREGLMRVLTANLDGAGPLRTVAPALVMRRWQGGSDPESAAGLGRATGAGIAVTGRVDAAGDDSVRIVAMLVDAAGRQPAALVEVRGRADRFDQLTDSLTIALLRDLGRTRPIRSVRHASIGARSLPALKAFLNGEQLYRRTQWDSALTSYRQAVELDSTFALALRRIGNVMMWQSIAGGDVAREFEARAGRFNRGLPPRDSLLVMADSLGAALYRYEEDPDWWAHSRRHAATLAEAGRRYPDDPEVWTVIGEAGFHFRTVTGSSRADILAAFDRAILLDSSFAPAYLHPISLAIQSDTALALTYARAYLRHARADVTARGIALVERTVRQGRLSTADSTEYASTDQPAELFEAWAALNGHSDTAESAVRVARWLAARRWATPMPFADPDFNTGLLARTLAQRGHVEEAWRVAGSRDADLFAQLAWLGGVPAGEARPVFGRWEAEGAPAARGALPWWAGQRDTAALSRFIRRRASAAAATAAGDTTGRARIERDRAAYDVAAGRAWLALAKGDTATATALFLAVPDSLCPACFLHRLPRAELLLRANRADEARALVGQELTAIVGGPHPIDTWWQLARAEAAEQTGDVAAAAAGYARVLDTWHNADPSLQPYLERARAGLERTARSAATQARR